MDKEKNIHRLSIPPRDGIDGASTQPRTALNKVWSVSVSDSDAAKISCVNCEWREVKSWCGFDKVWCACKVM
jgi:hypothetical protein